MTQEAFICDAVPTPIGRYAGALATVRTDDLAAAPISALALGHPLGMSGARMVLTATRELERRKSKRALCTMCVGVGQGIYAIIERV
jgi:acetyl-CoA acyltransferase